MVKEEKDKKEANFNSVPSSIQATHTQNETLILFVAWTEMHLTFFESMEFLQYDGHGVGTSY